MCDEEYMLILVNPKYPSSPFPDYNHFPIGLGYISENLMAYSIDHKVIDLNYDSLDDLFALCEHERTNTIAYSLGSLDIHYHYSIIKNIRNKLPQGTIIVGGPHVSFVKEQVFSECPQIDVALTHEGEFSLIDALLGNYEGKKGIIYRNNSGDVFYSGDRDLIQDFSTIPFPQYRMFNVKNYNDTIPIIFSRGCPYQCTFCGAHLSMGRKYRHKTAQQLFEEVFHWYQIGRRHFHFVDSEFCLRPEILLEFVANVKAHNMQIRLSSDGIRGKSVNKELMQELKQFGLEWIAIGVESANDDILQNIKKGETLKEIEAGIQVFQDLHIAVVAFFIIGLPGETATHVFHSLRFALRFPIISQALFFNLNPLPMTEVYWWADKNNFFSENFQQLSMYSNIGGGGDAILISTPELPLASRAILLKLSKKISRIIALRYSLYKKAKSGSIFSNLSYAMFLVVTQVLSEVLFVYTRYKITFSNMK